MAGNAHMDRLPGMAQDRRDQEDYQIGINLGRQDIDTNAFGDNPNFPMRMGNDKGLVDMGYPRHTMDVGRPDSFFDKPDICQPDIMQPNVMQPEVYQQELYSDSKDDDPWRI